MPSTRRARSTRRRIGLRCGKSPLTSVMGPALPPQISSISCVARSIALRVAAKSTPRSKRCAESELKPRRKDLPAISSGLKNALSRNKPVAPCCTPLSIPPMMPASARGLLSSAISSISGCRASSSPFNSCNFSPDWAYRTCIEPTIFSRSKACRG